uniref:Uncharacterized protein n=1 Tax=Vitis vinifera TaxID=29760 RepID=A5BWV8_VITVI|nr:hypothetical protein VITISV_025820 [Vitis vinifera]
MTRKGVPNLRTSRGRPDADKASEQSHLELPLLTPLTVSYEKLLPMIRDLSDFRASIAPKAVMKYIHGGPLDEEYDSKRKRQRLMRAASIWERINSIHPWTLGIGDFDVRRILVDPVQASPVILNVQFSVVEYLSSFNAILRHTWLHYMKAIPSTYHQMVSFLIEDVQIDLYGSQLAAHQCYQIAR